MATYAKLVMFFGAAGGKQGWQEDWYWSIAANDAFGTALADAKSLATYRRQLLGSLHSLEAVRVEQVDSSGASFLVGATQIGYAGVGAGPGVLIGPCQNPWLALLTRWTSATSTYARNYLIRGIPDGLLCIGPTYTIPFALPGTLRTAWENYRDFFLLAANPLAPIPRSGQFMMRVKDKTRGRALAIPVKDIAVAAGTATITTGTAIKVGVLGGGVRDAVVGDTVHVHGLNGKWSQGLNGDATITNLTEVGGNFEYDLDATQRFNCTVKYNKKAVVWGVSYILIQVAQADTSRVVSKGTGAPFFGTRGRQRKRC